MIYGSHNAALSLISSSNAEIVVVDGVTHRQSDPIRLVAEWYRGRSGQARKFVLVASIQVRIRPDVTGEQLNVDQVTTTGWSLHDYHAAFQIPEIAAAVTPMLDSLPST